MPNNCITTILGNFFNTSQSLWPAIKTYWEGRAPGLSAVGWKVPKKMSENWVQPKDFPIFPIYHIWVFSFCPRAIPKKSDLAGEVWLWAPLNPPNLESERLECIKCSFLTFVLFASCISCIWMTVDWSVELWASSLTIELIANAQCSHFQCSGQVWIPHFKCNNSVCFQGDQREKSNLWNVLRYLKVIREFLL